MDRKVFPFKCDGYVQSLVFNGSGNRLAAASADQKIYVWTYENGWRESASWNAHHGAVYKVRWAPEDFGTLIASCSFDKTIRIWEEKKERGEEALWKNLATLVESKEPVVDIRFAPRCYGLVLAACSLNGEVRIYDATDLLNLALWTCTHTFEATSLGCNCLAWNSTNEVQMLVIGNNDVATARLKLGAVKTETEETLQVWALAPESKRWVKLSAPRIHQSTVIEVDWAPRMGRKVHCLASSALDGSIAIWRMTVNAAVVLNVFIEFIYRDPPHVFSLSWSAMGNSLITTSEGSGPEMWTRCGLKSWKRCTNKS